MAKAKTRSDLIAIGVVLALVTLVCYWPVRGYKFLDMDDTLYVSDNSNVTGGLTWSGIRWAFTTFHQSNWHPLTWLSHQLDCQLFGVNPGPAHLENLLLHIVNSCLVLWLLFRLTGAVWRSAFVAALFAWHPLHVESVAWIAERKDVLSTLFCLLTLLAYHRYARRPSWQVYALTLALFALGLMAKPMLVTVPFVMLLLDYWPLQRWQAKEGRLRLLAEKVPFLALAAASSVVTFLAQRGVAANLRDLPLSARLANAVVSCASYLYKTFWPVHLAPMYSHQTHLPMWQIISASLMLAAVTALCVWGAKRWPYLFTGWFWFLGTLVPVIGLVQVGAQAMADRYMYIPSIGLFVLVAWGVWDLSCQSPALRRWPAVAGVLALAGCAVATRLQVGCWQNEERLYRRAIAATGNNYVAYELLGNSLLRQGRDTEALACYQESVRIQPGFLPARACLGMLLLKQGRLEEAVEHLKSALSMNPHYRDALVNLGVALTKLGRLDEAAACLREQIRIDPRETDGWFNLGVVLLQQQKLEEAAQCFLAALQLKPDHEPAHSNLGVALMQLGRPQEGIVHLREAVRLAPDNPRAHLNLGFALNELHQPAEAVQELQKALTLARTAGQNDLATQIENMLRNAQPAP